MSTTKSEILSFNKKLRDMADFIDGILKRFLADRHDLDPALKDAMTYSLFAPGKRIRSILVLWTCELVAGEINPDAEASAAAIEMVHTYSLIHDDLPAMDDDDMRRGQLTCHKAFNEATAILAGDGLLTLGFEILANAVSEPAIAVKLISELSAAAGASGMIAGQMADMRAENTIADIHVLEQIHINKTAKIFRCATTMGAICGRADDKQLEALSQFGLKIGLGFQIADDILDVSASSEQLGKTTGKDEKANKCTYPAVVGVNKARQLEKKIASEAIEALECFGEKAVNLRQLALAMLQRTK